MSERTSHPSQIIGGMFGLEDFRELPDQPLPYLQGKHILLTNARSGIRLLVEQLRPANVWMPSYLCSSMIQAVNPAVSRIRFYEVDYDLEIPSLEWLESVQAGDLVICIAYFGFPILSGLVNAAMERAAWVLEDNVQALLSLNHDPDAHFQLYSLRKFFGVPDGAILAATDPGFEFSSQLSPPPSRWWMQALNASLLRREFDRIGGERDWFRIANLVDSAAPLSPHRMSELSELILRYRIDYQSISARRIANYQTLLERLEHLALFPSLPGGVVPLGFPVRLADRDRVRQRLFDQQIYPPVHWDIRRYVPESFQSSHRLSRDILTLVCDQRYDEEDMCRTAAIVRGME
ncbi:MAG: hypothetical protein A2Z16_03940 [Chloroflexi bacterium RBG_16_54_18]|nr:MAG: hypothetical protein A2Z16_03940 [Chloroflexi bacterium RBG_16_54_18]